MRLLANYPSYDWLKTYSSTCATPQIIKWTTVCMQPAEFTTRKLIKILKQQMCESQYSLLCSADLKNEWNYTSTPFLGLHDPL